MLKKKSDKEIDHLIKQGAISYVSGSIYLSEANLFKYADKLNWYYISWYQKLSENFMRKYSFKLSWSYISAYQKLSESFIEEYADKVDWYLLSNNQKLSEKFIDKHINKFNWENILCNQKLSEEFIEKHTDKLNWKIISEHQKLSDKFIEKHCQRFDWFYISRNQKLSEEFIEKYKHQNGFDKKQQLDSHHDKRTKKRKLKEMSEYADKWGLEFNEDEGYLIAYRNHDQWYHGMFNGAIYYDKPGYYNDWRCDLNPEIEDSFGLGIWPKGNVKVRIDVDDWGCEVKYDSNGKIRVFGFTLLNIN